MIALTVTLPSRLSTLIRSSAREGWPNNIDPERRMPEPMETSEATLCCRSKLPRVVERARDDRPGGAAREGEAKRKGELDGSAFWVSVRLNDPRFNDHIGRKTYV